MDREVVEREIVTPLRAHGVDTWYSTDDIQTASEWERQILQGLMKCDWFLVALTPQAVDSEWVRREVHWAITKRKNKVVPVMLETCEPEELHLGLLPIQYIDFRDGSERALERLLAVRGLDNATPVRSSYVETKEVAERPLRPPQGPVREEVRRSVGEGEMNGREESEYTSIAEGRSWVKKSRLVSGFILSVVIILSIILARGFLMKSGTSLSDNSNTSVTSPSMQAADHNKKGEDLSAQEKYPEAEVEYRKAAEAEPGNAKYHNDLGYNFYNQDKYAEAEAEFKKAIELDPNNADYHNRFGLVLAEQKKYEEAEAEFRKAVGLDPDVADYHDRLGTALDNQNKYKGSETEFRKAIALNPNNDIYYFNLGHSLRNQKKYEEAEAEFRKAIRLDPNVADYYAGLGISLFSQRKYKEAEAEYRKALDLDPNVANYYVGLALFLHYQKRHEEEAEARSKALQIEPNNEMVDKVLTFHRR